MKAHFKKRLLKLAAFLEALPRKRFDIRSWVGSDWQGKPDLSCGTTACALGWATTLPEFRRLGVRMSPATTFMQAVPCIEGTTKDPMEVSEHLFGIDDRTHMFLFAPHMYPSGRATAKDVAKRIRKLVETQK